MKNVWTKKFTGHFTTKLTAEWKKSWKKKNLNQNFGKCVNKKVHWTLETYVHYEMPFEKHFNSFRKSISQCTARILRNLQMWIYNSHPATTFDFWIFWKERGNKFDIWNLSNEFGYGIWKKTNFLARSPQFGNVITEKKEEYLILNSNGIQYWKSFYD